MTKKKVVEPPKEIICEVAPHLTEGEIIKLEPNEPTGRGVSSVKVRKALSQESLDKLAKARVLAYKKRMELKAERENPRQPEPPVLEEPKIADKDDDEDDEEPNKLKKDKKKKKKKPIIVVEQSSSDSDSSAEQQVVYIKKKKEKKKVGSENPDEQAARATAQATEKQPTQAVAPPEFHYVSPNFVQPRYGYNPSYSQQFRPSQISNRRHF